MTDKPILSLGKKRGKTIVQVKTPPRKVGKPRGNTETWRRMKLKDAKAIVAEFWPRLLSDGKLRIMSIGTDDDMSEDKNTRGLVLSKKKLNRCLATIVNSDEYLDLFVKGAQRVNIHGVVTGQISDDAIQVATQRRKREHARLARREMSTKSGK